MPWFTCGTSEGKGWNHQRVGSSLPFPPSTGDKEKERGDKTLGNIVHYQKLNVFSARVIIGEI